MNIYDLMTGVRLKLSDPRAGRPNDAQLLDQVCMQLRTVKRFERNTSNPWSLDDVIVETTPGEGTYQINVANFGTPLAVLSWAPELATWIPRLIPFFQPQNMAYDYGLQNNAGAWNGSWDGSNCTALRCAIFWTNGQPFIEFLPVPQLQASYKCRYLVSADGVNTAALTETLVSNENADIVQTRAALGLLAATEWLSPDSNDNRAYNAERRRDLGMTLSNDERELRRQFEAAALITTGPRMVHRSSVADFSG